jgi:ABC-type antimicrobial peptide transport system permease subunit
MPNTPSYSGTIPDASSYNGTYPTNPPDNLAQSYTIIYVPEVQITNVNFTVIGIAVGSMLEWNHGLYSSPLSEASYISYDSLNATFPEYNEASNLFFAKIEPHQIDQAQDTVRELYGSKYLLSTLTVNDALNPARTGIDNTFTILNAVVVFAVVNAAVGVAAIMVMNISERRREIGIVRSLGMSRFQVVTSIIGEASVLAGTGFAIGTIAGLILNRVTIGFMRVTGFPIPYSIPLDSIWLSLLLAVMASLISAAYPAYHASKLKIVDSLKH